MVRITTAVPSREKHHTKASYQFHDNILTMLPLAKLKISRSKNKYGLEEIATNTEIFDYFSYCCFYTTATKIKAIGTDLQIFFFTGSVFGAIIYL